MPCSAASEASSPHARSASTIRDVVLIDRLSLAFRPGLCVLTGETGAGKSILLDALGLALGRARRCGPGAPGRRAGRRRRRVRRRATITRPRRFCARPGIGADLAGTIVLRRLVGADGRSRAFVNDEPASVGLLRELGDSAGRDPGPGRAARPAGPGDASRAARRLCRAPGRPRRAGRALARVARPRATARPRRRAPARRSRAEEDLLRHH